MKADDLITERYVLSGSWRWGKPWVTISSWQSSTTSWSSLWSHQVRLEPFPIFLLLVKHTKFIFDSFCYLTPQFQTSRRESSRWLIGITSRETRTTQINTTTWLRIILPTIVSLRRAPWHGLIKNKKSDPDKNSDDPVMWCAQEWNEGRRERKRKGSTDHDGFRRCKYLTRTLKW